MPTTITMPLLASINNAVSTAYNDQLYRTETKWEKFCYTAMSTGAASIYPRLDMLPGLREWIGDRVVQSLSQSTFSITNKTFEQTIGINREQIEDDQFGILTPMVQELARNVASFPDILVANLLKVGNATVSYDGSQNFFDVAHTNYTSAGAAATVANYVAGGSAAWYLMDVSRTLQPMIVQKRRPFVITSKTALTDDNVFNAKEFVWGADGRMNVGFGIWQLAYMSQAALNMANLEAARTAMKSFRRPDGTPMGINPNLLVVPSTLYATAQAYYINDYDPLAGVLTPNRVKGMFPVLENDWLN